MRMLLLSTALVAGSGLSALAQDTVFQTQADPATQVRASDLIGMRVYNSEAPVEGDAVAGIGGEWDDLGEINDLVVSRDGTVQAVLVDIGGFLGVGERQVAVDMSALRFVADDATADNANDFFLVLNAPRATLEEAPAYEGFGAAMTGAAAGAAAGVAAAGDAVADGAAATGEALTGTGGVSDPVTDGTATTAGAEGGLSDAATDGTATTGATATEGEAMAQGAPAATSTTGADAEAQAQRQPIEREGYAAAAPETLTAEALTGARVYDANDEWIGDVSELVLGTDGQIQQAVIDVGGFLGIGEKPVAVQLQDMDILQAQDGSEVRVFLQRTREELEALPSYEG